MNIHHSSLTAAYYDRTELQPCPMNSMANRSTRLAFTGSCLLQLAVSLMYLSSLASPLFLTPFFFLLLRIFFLFRLCHQIYFQYPFTALCLFIPFCPAHAEGRHHLRPQKKLTGSHPHLRALEVYVSFNTLLKF